MNVASIVKKMDLSTVKPNQEIALTLFQYVSQRTGESLFHLLEVYEEYFKIDLGNIKKNTEECIKYKPNPKFFLFHHALKAAIEAQDPESATAVVNYFKDFEVDDFTSRSLEKISFVLLDDEEWAIECEKISAEKDVDVKTWVHNHNEKIFLKSIVGVTEEVFDVIKMHHEDLYNEILAHVNTIILSCDGKLIGPLGYPLFGGTSVSYHGALFMQIPSDYVFFKELILEHIVHEAAHIHLNSILATDPLVLNDISELHTSSVRKDPRPLIGIYHAMFVSCRVLMAFNACRGYLNNMYMSTQYEIVQEQFNKAFAICESHAKLTKLGKEILENCREYIR